MKRFILISVMPALSLLLGCQSDAARAIHDTMDSVSNAIHARDISTLTPHLSKSSQQTLKETYDELTKLHEGATKLPLKDREVVESKLPPSVRSKKQNLLLQDLLSEPMKALSLDEHTQAGLRIVSITQESKTEAQVLTKSDQRFAFSLEDGQWKIHLFEKKLRALIEKTRSANQALTLTLERNSRRKQIESVLHNALKKNKK